jgi:hypothetical protein
MRGMTGVFMTAQKPARFEHTGRSQHRLGGCVDDRNITAVKGLRLLEVTVVTLLMSKFVYLACTQLFVFSQSLSLCKLGLLRPSLHRPYK